MEIERKVKKIIKEFLSQGTEISKEKIIRFTTKRKV